MGLEGKRNDKNSSILKELGWKPVSSKITLRLQFTSLNFKIQSNILGCHFSTPSQALWEKRAGCYNVSSGPQSGQSLESDRFGFKSSLCHFLRERHQAWHRPFLADFLILKMRDHCLPL